ncbi:MAG: hypothetical protein ABI378_09890 [Chitinophagaceae bacterium]
MRFALLSLLIFPLLGFAKGIPKPHFSGMYLQWGYNRDIFSRSDLHFSNGSAYDFTLHNTHANDQPDFSSFLSSPIDITIPQNSFRIGFYLNRRNTWAIELNFDHAKYVVNDDQTLRVTGQIGGRTIDQDTVVRLGFIHLEHTNGANFYHINYVHQHYLIEGKKYGKLSYLLKGGAGLVVPRSDVRIFGKRLDNEYHVAGYVISAEAGMRYYPLRNFFLELNGKTGFANYLNALSVDGGKVQHHFWYAEVIFLAGYDLNLGHKRQRLADAKIVYPGLD